MSKLLVVNLNNKNIMGMSIIPTNLPLINFWEDPSLDLKYIVKINNSKHTNSPIITSIKFNSTTYLWNNNLKVVFFRSNDLSTIFFKEIIHNVFIIN